ncbi:MAG: hypothetical protein RIN56_17455 [Sporomusaceae bacterium]|nr:hypothetical protein [Sporomusaceae bacterium]
MKKSMLKLTAVFTLLMVVLLAAGCGGGGGGAQRITGLSADGVVKTFFEAAKGDRLNDAALYVSPSTANDPRVVIKYLTGKSGLADLKNANLLSLRKAAEQGDYAVVVATLQTEQNSLNMVVRPVGLEKINGEWYIVDLDKIYQDAKYKLLQQLISKI